MAKFRKKPVVIDAITFEELVEYGKGNGANIVNDMPWSFEYKGHPVTHENDECYLIPTLEGTMCFTPQDVLVTGVKGEIYPCKKDIFEATYEAPDEMLPALFPYQAYDIEKQLALPWNISQVNAPSFWQKTKGNGAIIAIVDTGIDAAHPEFTGRIIGAYNFNGGRYDDVSDADGHGTHVAGIAAGATCGVAPEAQIMPLKVFGSGNTGEAIKEAFRYIYKWNAEHSEIDRVVAVNCSFGSGAYDIEQAYLIRRLVDTGVTVCVAAGNQGDGKPDTEEVFNFPGYIWECLTTGALNQDGQPAGYSSSYDGIDIAAPGTQIYSAWPGKGYKLLSGTSMATPHITGAMALIYSEWHQKKGEWPTEAQAVDVLMRHIRKVDVDHRFVGNGVLDLTWVDNKWPVEEIVLTLNSNVIYVDGEERAVEQAPVAMVGSNRSVIPVHGVFEPFGIGVKWKEETRQVVLTRNE